MISNKALGVVISLFLVCAAVMPFVFLQFPNDDTIGELTLVYEYYEMQTDGSSFNRFDTLSYVVSPNNLKIVMHTQYYCGYALVEDVQYWNNGVSVTIGMNSYSALIVGTIDFGSYDCWICQKDNQTTLLYDMDSGILVNFHWNASEREIETSLSEMDLVQPGPYVKLSGILLAGIFVELALIVWLLGQKLERM